MGLALGVLHEALASYDTKTGQSIEYCTLDPLVYFDIGFKTGAPLGRVTVRLSRKEQPVLTEHLVKLCVGEYVDEGVPLSYSKTPIQAIHSKKGFVLAGNNSCGFAGFAASSLTTVEVRETKKSRKAKGKGSLVMLPYSFDATRFGAEFYFYTGKEKEVFDGTVVGEIVDGFEVLSEVYKFGTPSGNPSKQMFIHTSGQH